jgi:hypothetical protein
MDSLGSAPSSTMTISSIDIDTSTPPQFEETQKVSKMNQRFIGKYDNLFYNYYHHLPKVLVSF